LLGVDGRGTDPFSPQPYTTQSRVSSITVQYVNKLTQTNMARSTEITIVPVEKFGHVLYSMKGIHCCYMELFKDN
jgi:hypothetical protein